MSAREIIDIYIAFFEKRGHKRIPNSPLVPENDPTTLFTSSGMQPLVPYLLGQPHHQGNRLVDVQNCFRAVDIDEVGDNRHTTFFRMLGNWSLGDYFKAEEIPWLWEFLTRELGLPKEKLYITVFEGFDNVPKDTTSYEVWKKILEEENLNPNERISYYAAAQNWWSRSGTPELMPVGEIGGPDTEVFFDFETPHDTKFGSECHPNCQCGRFIEIANSVFIQYKKTSKGFEELPKRNVDFGAGVERLLAAALNQHDMFQTSLFSPIISVIEKSTDKEYKNNEEAMRITADHFIAATFIINSTIKPSNKDQGYILRRLIRRGLDNFYKLEGSGIEPVLQTIAQEFSQTDPQLPSNFEQIKNTILEEEQGYKRTLGEAKKFISKRYKLGDELKGVAEISADDAFYLYASHGLSPTQIKSLGLIFDELDFADKMEEHQKVSRRGADKKFAGGLADQREQTIRGHTGTHLLHQAIRDLLGDGVHQSGSNITSERVRFDFNFDRNLTPEETGQLERKVNEKIKENLPVKFEVMSPDEAKKIGAIGLFDEKYSDKVKVYFIGEKNKPYSVEFCGGPHVNFTSEVKSFKIIKQENLGRGLRRIYAKVG